MGIEQTKVLRSTIRWAQMECKRYVDNSPWRGRYSKQMAVEEFIDKMDRFSCKNKNTSMIFSIAKDVGMSYLDELIMKGEAR